MEETRMTLLDGGDRQGRQWRVRRGGVGVGRSRFTGSVDSRWTGMYWLQGSSTT